MRYVWRRIDVEEGLGFVSLEIGDETVFVEGTEIITDRDGGWLCHFEVETGRDWVTRAARVRVLGPGDGRSLELSRSSSGSWVVGDQQLQAPRSCVDVDIAATPFTNTFPIRRLTLDVHDEQEIDVVWVDVPSLEVKVTRQRYERLSDSGGLTRYVYSSAGSASAYELTVDRDGVVVDYESFARRLGPSSS